MVGLVVPLVVSFRLAFRLAKQKIYNVHYLTRIGNLVFYNTDPPSRHRMLKLYSLDVGLDLRDNLKIAHARI